MRPHVESTTVDRLDSSIGLTVRCIPWTNPPRVAKPSYPTPAQAKAYIASYDTVPIRGLRAAFDAYRAGTADEDTMRSLRPYGAALVADRFRLISIDRALIGGYFITVQFTHHTGAVYLAWLYMLGNTEPSIRAFAKGRCSPTEQRWMAITFGPWSALGDDGSLMRRPANRGKQ